jgi:hypothetical protein
MPGPPVLVPDSPSSSPEQEPPQPPARSQPSAPAAPTSDAAGDPGPATPAAPPDAAATPQSPAPTPSHPDTPAVPATWTVAKGDSFWHIATALLARHQSAPPSEHEVGAYWERLMAANAAHLAHPGHFNLVYPGQELTVPPP